VARCPDLIVLGAGPAACAAALAACRRGLRVQLRGQPAARPRGSLEVLSGRARVALAALGIASPAGRTCSRIVSRWGTPDFLERSSGDEPGGAGLVIDRADFDAVLLAAACKAGAHFTHCRVRETQWDAATPVIVATGRRLPRWASEGAQRWENGVVQWAWRPGRSALCGTLVVDRLEDAWWYALGDLEGTTLALRTPHAQPATQWQARVLASDWLPAQWATVIPQRRPAGTGSGPPPRWTAMPIGDSALCVDPLTGHGLAFAMESAQQAVQTACDGPHAVQAYADWLHARRGSYLRERAAYLAPPVHRAA